jgi:ABC-type multidrug transport system fused ATPase/permease subunit
LSHKSDSDSRLQLKRIKNIIPKLRDEGKRKGASNKRCIITLYAASSLTNLKPKGNINKRDGSRYFSISTLRDIAKNKERILGSDIEIPFDTAIAKKAYESLEREGLVKFLPKRDISKSISRGDTSPVAITLKGKNHCRMLIDELVDDDGLIESQATIIRAYPNLEYIQECGLNLLQADYFEFHPISEKDIEKWREGFSFELQSIKMQQEFRREKVIEDITTKLDSEGKLLIVGESGTSKSTTLMEIMCDYFDKGFKILYNYGDTEIKNVDRLISLIEAILKDGNKVLVAIDNVHEERTSSIFYVIDKLYNFRLASNLKIILTARLPDFEIFTKEIRQST